ncbi:MAG: S8 family serine peptidase, partial [Thermomicrobiales bacterium]|nr:S8 family serine peptidase [Thermomicrobiales bacterium]
AVCATVNAGIPVIVAAGNQAIDASTRVPAAYDQVITVSAMADSDGAPGGLGPRTCTGNRDDTFASFSNFGPDVDIAAPGDCILSFIRGDLLEASGTSVATPHVTGAVARFIASFHAEYGRRPTSDETRAWLLSDGSRPQDSPEGFTGDPDPFHEPILWVASAFPGH